MDKRAWQDARDDYLYGQARIRTLAWKVFLAFIMLGLGYKFFYVEVVDAVGGEG